MHKLTDAQIAIAERICDLADAEGTIQSEGMLALSREGVIPNDPTLHTTTSLDRAFVLADLPADTAFHLWG